MDINTVPITNDHIINDALNTLTGNKPRWVLWRLEDGGKKIPYTRFNKRADVTNPEDWITYAEAQEGLSSGGDYDGPGLILDETVLGIDLDKCLNEAGEVTDAQLEAFIFAAKTYTEVSPSGTGLHLLFKLTAPITLHKNRHAGIEIYTKNRYLTFSRKLYTENLVRTITPAEAEPLLNILGYPWLPKIEPAVTGSVLSPIQPSPQLDAVKEKMFASKRGSEIKALYNGDISQYGEDPSKADAAFCRHLTYWTNSNREAIKTLWLTSPLGQRHKTQHREDYVERTLDLVLGTQNADTMPSVASNNQSIERNSPETPTSIFTKEEMDLEDLLKLDVKVEWDVEQLITKGSLNMIASAPHQGKTFMALHIAVCVANGMPVFGHFKVTEAKNVLIVNEEDILADIKSRLECMVPAERTNKRIKLYCSTGLKISPEWVDGLLERAREHDAGLIILDSLAALSLANENEAQAMQQVMDQFRRIINAGITVIFIHHNRKGQNNDNGGVSSMEMARGSTAITAAVHGYLSIQALANNQFKISQVKLKANVAKAKPFLVQMHDNITAEAAFRYEFEYLGEYNSELNAVEKMQDRLIQYCRSRGPLPFTRKTLVEAGFVKSAEDKTLRDTMEWLADNGYLSSQKYSDLTLEKQQLISTKVTKKNTLVYIPTMKLLESIEVTAVEPKESDVTDIDDIPF